MLSFDLYKVLGTVPFIYIADNFTQTSPVAKKEKEGKEKMSTFTSFKDTVAARFKSVEFKIRYVRYGPQF
ncbi:hypothetical protein A0J61_04164 [Choanephora cucurbitarum]|uniref:Uncharacterized protein n=1 Tax=Choanephora cucurbitarum TaxID=101091 RepID=A0A1C7NGB5_9FUNG|nr:hypothetical protein A0J61_04164 [Choanephora cucurbitarum]